MDLIHLENDKVFNLNRLCAIMPDNQKPGGYWAVFDGGADGWIGITEQDRKEILLRYTSTGNVL